MHEVEGDLGLEHSLLMERVYSSLRIIHRKPYNTE